MVSSLAHVRGAPKRRKAYFLTEKGKQTALVLREDIMRRKVVLEHDGRAQELSVADALKKIGRVTAPAPSFYDLVEAARTSDAIRTETFPKVVSSKSLSPEFAERSHGRPKVESFFGREAEKKEMLQRLEDANVSALLLWGIPGIGKSTLASKVFDELSGKRPLLWYSFREWDSESTFMASLVEFLTSQDRRALAAARSGSTAEVFSALIGDLACGAVLFLDDIQKCSGDLLPLLSVVIEAARASKASKVVLISRMMPLFFPAVASGNASIELKGLDRDAAWHMAQSLSAKDSVRIVDESHGHPLLLSLMARSGVGKATGDVSAFIEREISSAVTDQERRALEMLSVYRHPVPLNALPGTSYEIVSKLKQKALVFEQEEGIGTHDLLREFFVDHLDAGKKRDFHMIAAAFCEQNPEIEWRLETLYHYVEAGDWGRARNLALGNASDLAKDFPGETLALVQRIPAAEGDPKRNAELLFVRGQLLDELGDERSALDDFDQSLALLGKEGDREKRALVMETIAKVQGRFKKWSESLRGHEDALRLYERSDDKSGQIREWMNIGSVQRRKGDFGKARSAYSKALSLASSIEDRSAEAACLNNIGLLDRDEGRLREAEGRLKESVRLARTMKDYSGEAMGLENLAELYRAELRSGEMVELLLQSSEAFRQAGDLHEAKRVQAVCAEALRDQGRMDEAIALSEKALNRQDLRRRQGLFRSGPVYDSGDLSLSAALIDFHRASKDAKKAQKELGRFTLMAESTGDRAMIARGKLLQALIYEDADLLANASKQLSEAEAILRGVRDIDGLVAVLMRAGAVEEKRGDFDAARKRFLEAAHQAEQAGNDYAHHLATDRIEALKRAEG